MSKTAALGQDGFYDLSEPFYPYSDGLCFSRLAIHVRDLEDCRGTWVMGVVPPPPPPVLEPGQEASPEEPMPPQEHPAPLLQTPLVMEPAAALAVLGYTLA